MSQGCVRTGLALQTRSACDNRGSSCNGPATVVDCRVAVSAASIVEGAAGEVGTLGALLGMNRSG